MANRSVSVLRVPPPPARSVGKRGRARAFARRAGGAVAAAASDQKHTLFAAGAAYGLGYASRKGKDGKSFASSIPRIKAIGLPGTLAVACFGVGKLAKSSPGLARAARHMTTGFLAIAAHRAGVGKDDAGKPNDVIEGDDDEGEGDEYSGGYGDAYDAT